MLDCPSDTSCVRLSRCGELSAVAAELGDRDSSDSRKRHLLRVIRGHMCGDLKTLKRVHVCCAKEAAGEEGICEKKSD